MAVVSAGRSASPLARALEGPGPVTARPAQHQDGRGTIDVFGRIIDGQRAGGRPSRSLRRGLAGGPDNDQCREDRGEPPNRNYRHGHAVTFLLVRTPEGPAANSGIDEYVIGGRRPRRATESSAVCPGSLSRKGLRQIQRQRIDRVHEPNRTAGPSSAMNAWRQVRKPPYRGSSARVSVTTRKINWRSRTVAPLAIPGARINSPSAGTIDLAVRDVALEFLYLRLLQLPGRLLRQLVGTSLLDLAPQFLGRLFLRVCFQNVSLLGRLLNGGDSLLKREIFGDHLPFVTYPLTSIRSAHSTGRSRGSDPRPRV